MSPAMVTVTLSGEALSALDRHLTTHDHPRTREELIAEIVAMWAARQDGQGGPPDEGLRPEELNASNDS